MPENLGTLSAIGLSCTAGHRTLFRGLDFTAESGQWLMLTGPNGSGKSTMLRAMSGLSPFAAGTVRWRGQTPQEIGAGWRAQFLYQGHQAGWKDLFTAAENLDWQLRLDQSDGRVGGGVDEALERVGLRRQARLPFMRLSAGQRRRLALARLVCARRTIWLLDEPTTALDTAGQQLLGSLLDEHLEAGGCAVIATHQALPCRSEPLALDLTEAGAR